MPTDQDLLDYLLSTPHDPIPPCAVCGIDGLKRRSTLNSLAKRYGVKGLPTGAICVQCYDRIKYRIQTRLAPCVGGDGSSSSSPGVG